MVLLFKAMPKRTKYGNEILGKIKGFKKFLETAEKPRLEAMVMENPTYFYDILPYTYVLGVSDKWIKKFETISLFELLENCDMHVLNSIFLLLDSEKQKGVFDNDFEHLKENLDALRELRNCVEHHQLLIIKPLKKTWSNGEWQTSLQANVQNAINLSPKNARKNLKKLLNSCLVIEESENRSEENTYQLLPAFKVYFEDVE